MVAALSTQIKVLEDNLKSFIALAPSLYFEYATSKGLKNILNKKII